VGDLNSLDLANIAWAFAAAGTDAEFRHALGSSGGAAFVPGTPITHEFATMVGAQAPAVLALDAVEA